MKMRTSLNWRLREIVFAAIVPMIIALLCALCSLKSTADSYSSISKSLLDVNQLSVFIARIDLSLYVAVQEEIEFEKMEEDGDLTTRNPYFLIDETKAKCKSLLKMTSADKNISMLNNIINDLDILEQKLKELEGMIIGGEEKDKNMEFLEGSVYILIEDIDIELNEYISHKTKSLLNIKDKLDKNNDRIYIICILLFITAISSSILLTVNALKAIENPITKLCALTKKVSSGDFDIRYDNVDKNKIEEIKVLTKSFNDMTEKTGILIDNIKDHQRNLYMMESKLLQAQINPHFLYNTLDTIVWLAEDKQNEEVVSMVTALSNFFRITLNNGRDFISVEEEILHIGSYLQIQHYRYQDIVDYKIEISSDINNYIIPKLLLQPLIENALYHGIKNKRGKGLIRITGELKEECLVFEVSDTGKGMSTEKLKCIKDILESKEDIAADSGYGLVNVNRRLKYYYGKGSGVQVESEENKGTVVTVSIMKKVWEEIK